MTITCQAKPCEIDAPHYSIFCEDHTSWAKFVESQIREQIAQEIEAKCNCPESRIYELSCDFEEAAAIARGKNE